MFCIDLFISMHINFFIWIISIEVLNMCVFFIIISEFFIILRIQLKQIRSKIVNGGFISNWYLWNWKFRIIIPLFVSERWDYLHNHRNKCRTQLSILLWEIIYVLMGKKRYETNVILFLTQKKIITVKVITFFVSFLFGTMMFIIGIGNIYDVVKRHSFFDAIKWKNLLDITLYIFR